MRRGLGTALNRILRHAGLELRRLDGASAVDSADPQLSYMDDPALQDALLTELAEIAEQAFRQGCPGLDVHPGQLPELAREFWHTYRARPFPDSRGGGGFHNSFWIYLLARVLQPKLVIESGVWKGHTTWLLAQACPHAEIHGFDLDLGRLDHQHQRVQYHQHDWTEHSFNAVDSEHALVFFDCHVNHAQRIKEAHARGFRHLLFDDNPPLHKLYSYGRPGFPTAQMICSPPPAGETVSWHWRGTQLMHRVDRGELAAACDLIDHSFVFPDVGGPTRYGRFSFLTYVRLVRPEST